MIHNSIDRKHTLSKAKQTRQMVQSTLFVCLYVCLTVWLTGLSIVTLALLALTSDKIDIRQQTAKRNDSLSGAANDWM